MLGTVSNNSGSLKLHRIVGGQSPERVRLRELIAGAKAV